MFEHCVATNNCTHQSEMLIIGALPAELGGCEQPASTPRRHACHDEKNNVGSDKCPWSMMAGNYHPACRTAIPECRPQQTGCGGICTPVCSNHVPTPGEATNSTEQPWQQITAKTEFGEMPDLDLDRTYHDSRARRRNDCSEMLNAIRAQPQLKNKLVAATVRTTRGSKQTTAPAPPMKNSVRAPTIAASSGANDETTADKCANI